MNQADRDSLTALLNQTRDIFQKISHQIHWSPADSEQLDDLMNSKELQKDINNRIMRISGSRDSTGIVPTLLIYKAWQRSRAVYSFNQELVEDIGQTEDTSLYISLLERLPFRDMLFYYPRGTFPKPRDEETAGVYVHIETHPESLWIIFNHYDRNHNNPDQAFPGVHIAFPISDGMKISQIFETPQYLEWLTAYKRTMLFDHNLDRHQAEARLDEEKRALNTTLNLMYYLSSTNADIKAITNRKKNQKRSPGPKADNMPAIKHYEVGSQYSEIVFRHLKESLDLTENNEEKSNDESVVHPANSVKKRLPHARRAHWQHYWTGKGRTTLEVRWISDLFVGVNRDDQITIVCDLEKSSLKGKKNPNTSKRKRGR